MRDAQVVDGARNLFATLHQGRIIQLARRHKQRWIGVGAMAPEAGLPQIEIGAHRIELLAPVKTQDGLKAPQQRQIIVGKVLHGHRSSAAFYERCALSWRTGCWSG
jgi:hypothetical protein